MKKNLLKVLSAVAILVTISSCKTSLTMREPNSHFRFTKDDVTLSSQVTGQATTVRILGIDWKRLFKKKLGTVEGGVSSSSYINVASLPIIGTIVTDRTANYALYELITANPGYDVIFYPQYETVRKGVPFIYNKTTVKATARLGKLK